MPQMSPLMWGVMFTLFSMLMIMTLIKTYFNYLSEAATPISKISPPHNNPNLTWLW